MFDNELYMTELEQAFDNLAHTGVPHDANPPGRGSGRYGWGTGEHAFQHEPWYGWYQQRQKWLAEGLSDKEIYEKILG